MGLTYADLKLTNFVTGATADVRALVDTGAAHMFITKAIALQLGFDPQEMPSRLVIVADGRRVEAPIVSPITIAFSNRTYVTEAMVLGDEPLMGVLPIEAMDLVVDPLRQRVTVNPAHPDFPVFPAKVSTVGLSRRR